MAPTPHDEVLIMVRWIAVALLVVVAALGFVAWRKYSAPPPAAEASGAPMMPSEGMPEMAAEPMHPGVHWTRPAAWTDGPEKSMRLATYLVKDAECAVFYFGPGQGGSVDENVDMWASQFDGRPNPKRETRTVGDLKVTRVEIEGAYLSPGADMKPQGSKPGWKMLSAIVQGPQGQVFFKLTGPAATVKAAAKDFDAMLSGMHTD
jgi:hypothetical protein